MRTKHIALHVPDLERAEQYYRRVLDLDVVTREALVGGRPTDEATWAQLPLDVGWDDARRAGIDIQMVGLRRGALLLALFPGHPRPGTVFLVALVATVQEIAAVRDVLPDATTIEVDRADALTFLDPFGFRWQLCGPGFVGVGERHGRWLELDGREPGRTRGEGARVSRSAVSRSTAPRSGPPRSAG